MAERTGRTGDVAKRIVDVVDRIVVPLVWYSVAMLAVECHLYSHTDSLGAPPFFLWSERVVAAILTLEYLARCTRNSGRGFYPATAFGIVDLVAILPFWLGFVPALRPHLQLVRTLRSLRMLKFFRYSRDLQVMALGFYRAWFNLRPLLVTALVVLLFTMFALYEIEGPEQEEFRSLFNVGWFLEVTGTTVGYGDLSPQTLAGRAIVMLFMVAGLAIFMACFSAITKAFDEVFEQARDPAFEPLSQFRRVQREWEELRENVGEVGTTDAEDVAAEVYAEEVAAEEQEAGDVEPPDATEDGETPA